MFDYIKGILALLLLVAQPALATPQEQAEAALGQLDAAIADLDVATKADDRVTALTATIVAIEAGLMAMRSAERQTYLETARIEGLLAGNAVRISELLRVMNAVADPSRPAKQIHPGGVLGVVRAHGLLETAMPQLIGEGQALSRQLSDLKILRDLQAKTQKRLSESRDILSSARTGLIEAIADRAPLPKRFVLDPISEAVLIASSETLQSFASGLAMITTAEEAGEPLADIAPNGDLPLPAQGRILLGPGQPDAANRRRPGWVIEALPGALVAAPVPATVRFTGPLLDLGTVAILEPRAGTLFVIAGLEQVFAAPGEVLGKGAPIGLVADLNEKNAPDQSIDGDGTGTTGASALYIEVRENDRPVDPAVWFRTNEDG
jgi:septal ring factor EnvC (AmiA/AmiB activator)